MKDKLISEEVKRMRMIMGYNRSKTLNENFEMISEIQGAGATPPADTKEPATTNKAGGGTAKPSYTVPSEIKNVKVFQDWIISKGWGSELGPMQNDNKFGKYTSAAWDKHKGEYLGQIASNDKNDVEVSSSTGKNDMDGTDVTINPGATSSTGGHDMGGDAGQNMDDADVTINPGATNATTTPSVTPTQTSQNSTYSVRGGGPVADDGGTEVTVQEN